MDRVLSAGLLLYRRRAAVEVLLGHMGGPFWARKDDGAWSIPKGEHGTDEEPLAAARREFAEELGAPAPDVDYLSLGSVRLSSGKQVAVWAGEADFDCSRVISNTFDLEWPRGSGRIQAFPEIDRAAWFGTDTAAVKLTKGQRPFVGRLLDAVA